MLHISNPTRISLPSRVYTLRLEYRPYVSSSILIKCRAHGVTQMALRLSMLDDMCNYLPECPVASPPNFQRRKAPAHEPAMPSPTRLCIPGPDALAPAPAGLLPVAFVPVRSRIRRPSMRPLRPLFCKPMTLLRSPDHTSRPAPRSLSPRSELHSLPLTLVVALSSSLGGRPPC